jgi:hypothetical protein
MWEKISRKGVDALVAEGRPILRYKNRLIETGREPDQDGRARRPPHPVVTSCVLQSEIGGRLAKDHPSSPSSSSRRGGASGACAATSKGGVNVAEIAKRHGGGGHPNAAGFIEKIAGAGGQTRR